MGSQHSKLPVGNPPPELAIPPPPQPEDGHRAVHDDQHLPLLNDVHEEGTSPLLIEDTVQVILSHVASFGDLKEFRLVNSTWNRAATRVLRTRPADWIDFSRNEDLDTRQYSFTEMKNLLDIVETSSWILPITKISVDTSVHQLDPEWHHEKQAVVDKFFRAVAPFVKHLQLIESSTTGGYRLFPSAPAPQDIRFPVLEKLNFELEYVWQNHDGTTTEPVLPAVRESNLDFVRSILRNSPRLVEVQAGRRYRHHTDGTDLLCLTSLPKPLAKLTLCSVPLVKQFILLETVEAVRHVREVRLHLMGAHQPPDPHFSEALTRFLSQRRDTLEVLLVEVDQFTLTSMPIRIPELPRLKKLSLEPCRCPCSIRHSFPALQQLTLMQNPTMAPILNFAVVAQPMEELTSLELGLHPDLPTNIFGHVARLMPNLRKLSFTGMWSVYERITMNFLDLAPLEHVEELTFTCRGAARQVDSFLTGLSSEELAAWKAYPAELLKTKSDRARDPPAFLQRIKRLNIRTNRYGYRVVNLSDVSCRLVLLKMGNLKCLDLGQCQLDQPGISAHVLLEMRSRFSVLPLDLPTTA